MIGIVFFIIVGEFELVLDLICVREIRKCVIVCILSIIE